MKTAVYHSPFGDMELIYEEGAVTALRMAEKKAVAEAPEGLALAVFQELDEYFQGKRKNFDIPCGPMAHLSRKRYGQRSGPFLWGGEELQRGGGSHRPSKGLSCRGHGE